jgi:FtsP/CotA-like multicopper oxidase with cupredoxin domain
MESITRRNVLILGGVGIVAVGGGAALWALGQGDSAPSASPDAGSSSPSPVSSDEGAPAGSLREPATLLSANGLIDLTLTAALTDVTVAGTPVRALTFNDTIPGPTLRVKAGHRITVQLRNELDAPTNLHTHGLVVSPEGDSDNVFLMIDPGQSFDYDYRLGPDHPPGVFWYHPHHHGNSAEQLFGGLYGAIIVEDEAPIEATRERILIISDISVTSAGDVVTATMRDRMIGREGDLVMVNGQVGATVQARPGDRERWRIVNACASRFLRLRLDGQQVQLLGIDAGRYETPRTVEEIVLAPGNRADVLMTAVEGISVLRTLPFDRGTMGMMGAAPSATRGADLLTVSVTGEASGAGLAPVPDLPAQRDLRAETLTRERTVTLAMGGRGGGGGMAFTIDGRQYDHERIDIAVSHDDIEEWMLVNTSPMDHPFHLHVWPMQLIEVGGTPVTTVDWQDVVQVPAMSTTIVRIAFEGITGKTAYHCHILDHEDNGMMGVINTT